MMNKYIEEIERLNADYLKLESSNCYNIGKRILKLKQKGIYYLFCSIINNLRFMGIKQKNELLNLSFEEQNKLARIGKQNIRVVVYTCVTGSYDTIVTPYYIADNIDYVLFSDKNIENNIWQYREIPINISNLYSNAMVNRYIKFHPYDLFADDYDYAIYIDGNICPISDLSVMTEQINNKWGIAFHAHCARTCIYEEAKACKILNKGNLKKIKLQLEKYNLEGFPIDYGMIEGNVIVTDLKNNKAKKILDDCWQELILSDGGRDQLVLPYILWKHNIKTQEVSTLGNNVYKNPKLRITSHMD